MTLRYVAPPPLAPRTHEAPKGAALRLGVTVQAVHAALRSGRLAGERAGCHWKIPIGAQLAPARKRGRKRKG